MNTFGRNRRSIRLRDYDYSSDGIYYVTLCTQDRRPLFGEIKDGEMFRSLVGEMVRNTWLELSRYDSRVSLDEHIVMPDHFHGIIVIGGPQGITLEGEEMKKNAGQARGPAPTLSLSDLMQRFKSWTTHQYWKMDPSAGSRLWQRNYFEHIIRDDIDLFRIREYIKNNPKNWPLIVE